MFYRLIVNVIQWIKTLYQGNGTCSLWLLQMVRWTIIPKKEGEKLYAPLQKSMRGC